MYDESVFRPVWLREWYSWSKMSWSNDEVDVPCALWEEHTFPRGARLDTSDDSLLVASGAGRLPGFKVDYPSGSPNRLFPWLPCSTTSLYCGIVLDLKARNSEIYFIHFLGMEG